MTATVRAKKRAQKDLFRRTPNFQVGDYVLIGLPEPTVAGKKLYLKWRGPYRIVNTQNNYVFEVENIINNRKQMVHGDRGATMMRHKLRRSFRMTIFFYQVHEFNGSRINPVTGKLQFSVNWKEFSSVDDSWEDLDNLYMDVPVLVANYIRRLKSENHILADELSQFISANQKS